MASDSNHFLKKTIGEDFFESLTKFELWKPGTRTTIDHEEIKTALMIVPRVLMALLIRELSAMAIGETKEIHVPVSTVPALIRVTKHERDVYSGDVEHENKKVVDFKYRSIPGIGLVIMSAFELYDTSKLVEQPQNAPAEDITKKVQHLIDERLALHDLISKVVDKKLMEKDAIKQLILAKITEFMPKSEPNESAKLEEPKKEEPAKKRKESPLKSFLEKKKNKHKPAEFSIEMAKGEQVSCPDCGKNIFDGQAFSGCICLGDDREKKIYVKKTEEGIKIRFGKSWDKENIEMLLEVLRSKNRG